MNLTDRIAKIMSEIGTLVREGERDDVKKYKFVSTNSLKAALQPLLAKHGVTLVCEDVQLVTDDKDVTVLCRWAFHAGDECVRAMSAGAAQWRSNKGSIQPEQLASAQTRALAAVLRGSFLIPEADDERQAARLDAAQAERRGADSPDGIRRSVHQMLTSLARTAKGSRDKVLGLRDVLLRGDRCPDEGEVEQVQMAVRAAVSGDWAPLASMCDDAGIGQDEEPSPAVAEETKEETKKEASLPEKEVGPPEKDAALPEKDAALPEKDAALPNLPNPRGTDPEYHAQYWRDALGRIDHPAVREAVDASTRAKAPPKVIAAGLETIYREIAKNGADPAEAIKAGRARMKEMIS